MKTGQTLVEMAQELERQKKTKRDFVAPTTELKLIDEKNNAKVDYSLKVNGHGQFGVNALAHEQIAGRLGIPQKYYDRMKTEAPGLLSDNVNHWFTEKPESRLIRTLDGNARAFLSGRYRPLDNFDLAETVLPIVQAMGCRIESSAITEKHLYFKAVTAKVEAKVVGDIVQAGIVISNSEVGCGSVKIEPLVFTLKCTNGMIVNDASLRKYHVGRGHDGGDFAEEFFRDETRRADDRAFWMKVRDVVNGAITREGFDRIVEKLNRAHGDKIKQEPEKAIEVVQEKFGLQDHERSGVLKYLLQGGDLSRYGLLNAITRTSQDVKEYERATELERFGGQVLELPKSDWSEISEN